MIGLVLAVLASALTPEAGPAPLQEQPLLSIDPCVGADPATVGALLDLELGSAAASGAAGPQSITVRCLNEGEEIRVEPWASLGPEGIRAIQLPPVGASDSAREGRSRELALAIAELIRRLQTTRPLTPPEPAPPPPAPVSVAARPPPAPPETPERWHVGAVSVVDHFGGGELLVGADLVFGRRLGRWLAVELAAGGRAAQDPALSVGRLTERAATGSAAVGVLVRRRRVEVGLALKMDGFLVQLRESSLGDNGNLTMVRGAAALEAEPRVAVAVARHVWLRASGGAGYVLQGIIVRQDQVETTSLTRLLASASFGAIVTF